jgi:hypothetical protein
MILLSALACFGYHLVIADVHVRQPGKGTCVCISPVRFAIPNCCYYLPQQPFRLSLAISAQISVHTL